MEICEVFALIRIRIFYSCLILSELNSLKVFFFILIFFFLLKLFFRYILIVLTLKDKNINIVIQIKLYLPREFKVTFSQIELNRLPCLSSLLIGCSVLTSDWWKRWPENSPRLRGAFREQITELMFLWHNMVSLTQSWRMLITPSSPTSGCVWVLRAPQTLTDWLMDWTAVSWWD